MVRSSPSFSNNNYSISTMAEEQEFDFSTGNSQGTDCFPQQASLLRKGGFVVMKDRPCKVVDFSTSKTGKHGHAKINLTGTDLFNNKKYEFIIQSTHNVMVPNVTRKEMALVDIDDEGFCTLMDDDGSTKEDLSIPEGELGEEIRRIFEAGTECAVTVVSAMGIEAILGVRNATAN